MRRIHETQNLMAEINITPFTDVILVLLIIFMVATPLISESKIEVKLPHASSGDAAGDSKLTSITITSEGVVYLENKVVTNKALKQKLKALLEKDPALKVMVSADKDCRFQEVVGVIDALKETGVQSLNIGTKTSE